MNDRVIGVDFKGIELRNLKGADGTLTDCVGLRHRHGAMIVEPRAEALKMDKPFKASEYTDYFIHTTSVGKNMIARRGDNIYYLFTEVGEEWQRVNEKNPPICSVAGEIRYEAIGNFLIITGKEVYITLLYNQGRCEYEVKQTDFNGLEGDTRLNPQLDIRFRVTEEYNRETGLPDVVFMGSVGGETNVMNEEHATATMLGVMKKERELGRLKGFCKLIYAYELFDGSTILHSQPILLGQVADMQGMRLGSGQWVIDGIDLANLNLCVAQSDLISDGGGNAEGGFCKLHSFNNRGIVFSLNDEDNHDGKPFSRITNYTLNKDYFYYNTGVTSNQQSPFSSAYNPANNRGFVGNNTVCFQNGKTYVVASRGNKLQYKVSGKIDSSYKDLIKGVSVYLTREVYGNDTTKKSVGAGATLGGGLMADSFGRYYQFPIREAKAIIEELEREDIYYKVATIEYSKLTQTTNGWVDIDLKKESVLANLEAQEILGADGQGRRTFKAGASTVYNGRLHLANFTEEKFKGFPLNYFFGEQGKGQAEVKSTLLWKDARQKEHIENFHRQGYTMVEVAVEIETETGREIVRRVQSVPPNENPLYTEITQSTAIERVRITQSLIDLMDRDYGTLVQMDTTGDRLIKSLNPMLSYPDSRAKKITITITDYDNTQPTNKYRETRLEFPLKESLYNDFAYYIAEDLLPIDVEPTTAVALPTYKKTEVTSAVATERNRLKVSAVDNPLFFPAANDYKIGGGEIVAIRSNQEAVGTGQTGATPLYAFCTDGVWGLFVDYSGQVAYNNARLLLDDVLTHQQGVREISGGFVMTTRHGLVMVEGNKSKRMDLVLEAEAREKNEATTDSMQDVLSTFLNHSTKGVELMGVLTTKIDEFRDYLKGAEIAFQRGEEVIFVYNKGKDYHYTIDEKGWKLQQGRIETTINNYPYTYVVIGDLIYNADHRRENYGREAMLITGAMDFGVAGMKELRRAVVRGWFKQTDDDYVQDIEARLPEPKIDRAFVFEDLGTRDIDYKETTLPNSELIGDSDFNPNENIIDVEVGIDEFEAEVVSVDMKNGIYTIESHVTLPRTVYDRIIGDTQERITYLLTLSIKIVHLGEVRGFNLVVREVLKHDTIHEAIEDKSTNAEVVFKLSSTGTTSLIEGSFVAYNLEKSTIEPYFTKWNEGEQVRYLLGEDIKISTSLGSLSGMDLELKKQNIILEKSLLKASELGLVRQEPKEIVKTETIKDLQNRDVAIAKRLLEYQCKFSTAGELKWDKFLENVKLGLYSEPFIRNTYKIPVIKGKYYRFTDHNGITYADFLYNGDTGDIDYWELLHNVRRGVYMAKPNKVYIPETAIVTQGENIRLVNDYDNSAVEFYYNGLSGEYSMEELLSYGNMQGVEPPRTMDYNAKHTVYNGENIRLDFPNGYAGTIPLSLEFGLQDSTLPTGSEVALTTQQLFENGLYYAFKHIFPDMGIDDTSLAEDRLYEIGGVYSYLPPLTEEQYILTMRSGKTRLVDLNDRVWKFIYSGKSLISYSELANNLNSGVYHLLEGDNAPQKYMGLYVFGSYDGVRYGYLGGANLPEGTHRDIRCEVGHNDCKYYKVVLFGTFGKGTLIEGLEVQGKPSDIWNDKLR